MQHLEWCYLPSTCKALPALAGPSKAQDSKTSVHTPNCSHENFTPMQRQSKTPTRRSMPLQQLQTCTWASGFRLGSDIYSVGLFYGFCTTQLCTVRLRNMAELGKNKMWTRKIRAMCIQADMKRSKPKTQHGLQQCCRSTTPSISITAVICSLSKEYVFFIFLKTSLSQSIVPD